MSKRLALSAALAAVAWATPAHGLGYWSDGSNGQVYLGDDARACFTFAGNGPHVVIATAAGLVSTSGTVVTLQTSRARRFSDYMADAVASVRSDDSNTVCVGGVGEPVVAGWAVFTFNAHGPTADAVVVITCSYHSGGKNCV